MTGTRMTLHRYGSVEKDWREILIIVDEEFIASNGLNVPIKYPYEPEQGLLDIYYNGSHLISGVDYIEYDGEILLNLGEDGNGEPNSLKVGDRIFIKVYHNHYCSRGGSSTKPTDKRMMVFVIGGEVVPNDRSAILRFPFYGEISSANVICSTPPTGDVNLSIKSTNSEGLSSSAWVEVVSFNLSAGTSATSIDLQADVSKDDYFIVEVGESVHGLSDLTVDIIVNI